MEKTGRKKIREIAVSVYSITVEKCIHTHMYNVHAYICACTCMYTPLHASC